MLVNNKILRVRRRDGALVNFDIRKVTRAILSAAESVGGFGDSHIPEINGFLFSGGTGETIAGALASLVTMTLNSDERHHIPNFPPAIEKVQDTIVHVLRSYGFVELADVYEAYRWGRHWIRARVLTPETFAGNGFPQELIQEVLEWNRAHECETVEKLNAWVRRGDIRDLVTASCDRYEAELDRTVERFRARIEGGDEIRVFIVAGPSSSGKTTTTCKLRARLEAQGFDLVMMNLDDYFWPVSQHPTDWIADRDYETPHALDYHLINQHLRQLLAGETIRMPAYDFKTGERCEGKEFSLKPGGILLLDCLHGLYPAITDAIPAAQKFKVYLETLNVILTESQNVLFEERDAPGRVPFTDYRLLRRMVRDAKHRNHPPLNTLLHWEKVRRSELANIIPLLYHADSIVNGGMPFDLAAIKAHGGDIFPTEAQLAPYAQLLDAQVRWRRVRRVLEAVEPMSDLGLEVIPGDCLVREFIGGSTLEVPHND